MKPLLMLLIVLMAPFLPEIAEKVEDSDAICLSRR